LTKYAFQRAMTMKIAMIARTAVAVLPWILVVYLAEVRAADQAGIPCVTPGEKIGYVGKFDVNLPSVVVFVHGVLSSSDDAWTYKRAWPRSDTYWPCLLRSDSAFRDSNIFVHSYRTAALSPSPSINDVATLLLRDLEAREIFNHSHITFVAHSMGGLVVSRMLLMAQSHRDYAQRVKLVTFYGTPGSGATIANIGRLLSSNVQFAEMSDPVGLKSISDAWNKVNWPFKWFCVGENKKTGWFPPVWVVPPETASALCNGRLAANYELDHIDLVKPDSSDADPHHFLFNQFQLCVAPLLNRRTSFKDSDAAPGQAARVWFNKFITRLTGAGRAVDRTEPSGNPADIIAENLLARSLTARYLVSDDRNDINPSARAGEYLALNEVEFSEKLWARLGAQEQLKSIDIDWMSTVRNLRDHLRDHKLLERRDRFRSSGGLLDEDYAIALRGGNSEIGRVLLLVGFQSNNQQEQVRIKGYFFVPPDSKACV
jgi:pimeloyl-ACP methyl ester carboxylesterase